MEEGFRWVEVILQNVTRKSETTVNIAFTMSSLSFNKYLQSSVLQMVNPPPFYYIRQMKNPSEKFLYYIFRDTTPSSNGIHLHFLPQRQTD